jgi:hypothetical protein
MFATWYYLCRVPDPLIKALLTFATINYAEEMKPVAMWPAPGSEDTELGVLMEPEVSHGETEVYAGVQA